MKVYLILLKTVVTECFTCGFSFNIVVQGKEAVFALTTVSRAVYFRYGSFLLDRFRNYNSDTW